MSNDNFLIEESDLKTAQKICSSIENSKTRNSSVANCFAANIALKYFDGQDVDTESGLHNIPEILNKYDISDIYIKGNYIDVRLYFSDNDIFVPVSQFKTGILPEAYMFIRMDEDLSAGTVSGFITPEMVNKDSEKDGYYEIEEDSLVSFYDIEPRLVNIDEPELTEDIEKEIFDFSNSTNSDNLVRFLIKSTDARKLFATALNANRLIASIDFDKNSLNTVDDTESNFSSDIDDGLSLETFNNETVSELNFENSFEDLSSDTEDVELLENDEDMELSAENEILEENNTDEFNPEITLDSQEDIEPVSIENTDNTFELDLKETDSPITVNDTFENSSEQTESAYEDNSEIVLDETDDEYKELSEYDYTTEITENIVLEEDQDKNDEEPDSEQVDEDENSIPAETTDELNEGSEEPVEYNDEVNSDASIDDLFSEEQEAEAVEEAIKPKKKTSPILPILGIIVLFAAAGYFAYTKYSASNNLAATYTPPPVQSPAENKASEDAMPNETVENVPKAENKNEGTAISIPEIEQNLGGSVDVSKLTVSWEVPSAFASNPTAKRYFIKLGKVMQLNLKTELLLQSMPPISNRIAIELEYNNNSNSFDVKNILASSGTAKIDEVIKSTVQTVLKMNLNMNTSVFGNLKGNPVLIIKL